MKILLPFVLGFLYFLNAEVSKNNSVDITGTFRFIKNAPDFEINELSLTKEGDFVYLSLPKKETSNSGIIKGTYKIKGNQVFFSPIGFKIKNTNGHPEENEKKKEKCPSINQSLHSTANLMTSFEVGNSKLQPMYFIKSTKNQLSLCVKHLKTNRFMPHFLLTQKLPKAKVLH